MTEARILMGVVGRPHGVRGLLHVHSYTAHPADLAAYAPLLDERGVAWTLAWRGEGVAELCDEAGRPVADRSAAERLVNMRLYAPRERLPEPEADEFYLADLIGLAAIGPDGVQLGLVAEIHDYGAGTSLEIARAGAPALMVPFTRAAIPDIDLAAGRLTILPPREIEAREVAA